MKKKTFLSGSVVLGALLLVGAGCTGNIQSRTSSNTPNEAVTAPPVTEGNTEQAEAPRQASAGRYEAYDESKLALAESGDVVLFFKADWCSSCRALDANIRRNLTSIPSDVTILRLNYDKELTLRRKYGVTTQHTLVQVDSAGTMLEKWVGSMTLAEVIKRVQ